MKVRATSYPLTLCGALGSLCLLAAMSSAQNGFLWIWGGVTIAACGLLTNREAAIAPTLLTTILLYWIGIAADLVVADWQGAPIGRSGGGDYRTTAILISYAALIVMSIGVKLGMRWKSLPPHVFSQPPADERISLPRAVQFYLFTFALQMALGKIAFSIPGLTQPLLALGAIHLVATFVLTRALLTRPSGLPSLGLLLAAEGAIGITGYISSFQGPFIVALVATISSRRARRFDGVAVLGAGLGFLFLLYVSLVWTAIKPEFRALTAQSDMSVTDRLGWIFDKVSSGKIDYDEATTGLLQRLGYTQFYGVALERYENGLIPETHFWVPAVLNVVLPRVLFPNKAALDDTAVTTLLTGLEFGKNTSVNIGYVAQSHVEFGFPTLLAPLLVIGGILGWVLRFFVSSRAPEIIRAAFTASVATTTFQYGENVEKLVGSFFLTVLGLAALLRFQSLILNFLLTPRVGKRVRKMSLLGTSQVNAG